MSKIEKFGFRPTASPRSRSSRAQKRWNVLTQTLPRGKSVRTRSAISRAALLVNVIARISHGDTPRSTSRAIRRVMTLVFPDPGPARTKQRPFEMLHGGQLAGRQIIRRHGRVNSISGGQSLLLHSTLACRTSQNHFAILRDITTESIK